MTKSSPLVSLFLMAALLLGGSSAFAQETTGETASEAAQLDLNTADEVALAEHLTGIGAARAAAIVAYREENGAFQSVDELTSVNGIGSAILADNRHLLSVD